MGGGAEEAAVGVGVPAEGVERQRLASWQTKIIPQYNHVSPGKKPRHDFSFAATLKTPTSTAHYWFGMLMDCYLEEYDAHPPPMKYSLLFMNGA